MSSKTDLLLEAHVNYEAARLGGDALPALIDEHVAALFRWFSGVKFDEAVDRAQILGVIERLSALRSTDVVLRGDGRGYLHL